MSMREIKITKSHANSKTCEVNSIKLSLNEIVVLQENAKEINRVLFENGLYKYMKPEVDEFAAVEE